MNEKDEKDDMKLPDEKTCADCWRFSYCEWLFDCMSGNVYCDFSPSKFEDYDIVFKTDEELN